MPAAQGATVNGVVSATAPFLAYRIAAASGDVLSLRSSSSTAGFASQMELYDPDGVRLDSGVFSLSRKARRFRQLYRDPGRRRAAHRAAATASPGSC